LLRTRIRAWELLQAIYMPGLLQHRHNVNQTSSASSNNPEDMELWLPSRLPSTDRERICVAGLVAYEEKLRTAQCHDALDSLRHVLTIKTRMIQFKNKNLCGQRAGTCSRAVIDRVHERARVAADKYQLARTAKIALSGPGEWENTLLPLKDEDVCSFQDPNRLKPRQARRGIYDDDQIASSQISRAPTDESSDTHIQADFSLFDDTRT